MHSSNCVCRNIAVPNSRLCENCVTECCTVVMSTAFAMDVQPVRINNFSYLQMKWRTPKAGVTGSNPVGRAIFFNELGQYSSGGIRFEWAVKSTVSPNGREVSSHPHRFARIRSISKVARGSGRVETSTTACHRTASTSFQIVLTAHCQLRKFHAATDQAESCPRKLPI